MVSVCVADDVVLFDVYFSLSMLDVRCDLSANIARCSKLIRGSLNPEGTIEDGGWVEVMSSS